MKLSFLALSALLFAALATPPSYAAVNCGEVFAPVQEQITDPKLIIFSAPSGGGKTTLAQLLVKDFPNFKLSVSSTTRAPRGQEKDGVDYHFLTREQFQARIAEGKFAEWAEVHGNYYGTDIDVLRSSLAEGQSVIVLPDVQGAKELKKRFPNDAFTIFITPPDMTTLEQRLRGRGTDSEAAIQLRLKNATSEIAHARDFDLTVVNDDLSRVHAELVAILENLGFQPQ